MSAGRHLSGVERAAATLMKIGMWAAEGYAHPFTDDLVRSFGVRRAAIELLRYRRLTAEMAARYGARDGHLLLGFAALWSGCGYCSVGHIFASNLLRFREQSLLFPIDQDEAEQLQKMSDKQAMERVRELLQGDSRYARVLALIERQLKLKRGEAEGTTDDDALLRKASNAALDLSNERGIVESLDADPHAVPPFSPVSRDYLLRHRYEAARQAVRKQRASVA